MRAVLAVTAALGVSGQASANHVNLTSRSGDIIGGLILKALNEARDTKINPAIAQSLPDPLSIQVKTSGKASAGCIIPNPFGGCLCHASADYSVSMKNVKGLKGLHVTNFTSAQVSSDMTSISIGANIADGDVKAAGNAKAGVSACHISPSASGSASTHARLQKIHLVAAAKGKLDLLNRCVKLSFSKVSVALDKVSIHDTSLKIELGPIPGVDVGKLVDLVTGMVPDLTAAVEKAVQGPISKAITKTADSGDIPCIKVPIAESTPVEDVLVV